MKGSGRDLDEVLTLHLTEGTDETHGKRHSV
jgi:hypothetical protein